MISTIIFDMDGVIIDSEPIHQQLEFEMFAELGLHISEEEHKDYIGTSAIDMWTKIGERHNLTKSPKELLLYGRKKYWKSLDEGKVPLVEGALDLIKIFHENKFLIQVASSATRPTVDKVLEHFSLEKYFKYRIGGDEVSKSKPEPEIFLKAAQQSGSDPENCLVIEDSGNGVTAAKSAGMFCIGYENSGTGKQNLAHADVLVKNLNEIDLVTIKSIQ
ncbi:MAG: HAD family phosphatase [Cyclobacteriaceae bacterium]|nr:HAD family phosphatase [Cyclobacteriaceae bacterium]MCK5367294.1 HAD family phosphatase [Cyclobacteriaceae bacterium]